MDELLEIFFDGFSDVVWFVRKWRWVILFLLANLVLLSVIIWRTHDQEQNCTQRGGTPITSDSRVICLKSGELR